MEWLAKFFGHAEVSGIEAVAIITSSTAQFGPQHGPNGLREGVLGG